MKKIALFLLIFVFTKTYSQSYQISFEAKGISSSLDSVKVENITQFSQLTLKGNDILNLRMAMGIKNLNNNGDNNLIIYPNPVNDYCIIEFDAPDHGKANIELFDIAGKRIVQFTDILIKGKHSFNISNIVSGIYIIKIESNTYSYSARIVSANNRQMSGSAVIRHIESAVNTDNQNSSIKNGSEKKLKSNKSFVDMEYKSADILKLTGYSGIYRTINILTPTKSQTVAFNFVACTDSENKNYAVVQIGKQIWMAENINTGTMIDGINQQTDNNIIEKYCYANDETYCKEYGGLYQWDEMMQYDSTTVNLGICPIGWHIPTVIEWTKLADTLGGWAVAGSKIMESGNTHWASPNAGTNESGFTALPAGYRNYATFEFYDLGTFGYLWSTTGAVYTYFYQNGEFMLFYHHKGHGFSVRCIKD